MTIDFAATRDAIAAYIDRGLGSGHGREGQCAGVMLGVCDDVLAGQYEIVEGDLASEASGFISWTRKRGLLIEQGA